MEKTIKNEITDKMEEFIISNIMKLIQDENFETIHEIEKLTFGKYSIKIDYKNNFIFSIISSFSDVAFVIENATKSKHFKTFFGFEYGKEIVTTSLTKVGNALNLYNKERDKFNDIKYHKETIDALPDDVKKSILRKRKFNTFSIKND